MAFEFNFDEIMQMAEQIERNGARFYAKAAEIMSDPQLAKMFQELSAWELGHEKIFAAIRARLREDERRPQVFDPDDQTTLYLRAMADGHVFDVRQDPAAMLAGKETATDILNMAIGQEKNSIVFYLGLKEFTASATGKEKIDTVIKEEMGHIAYLSRQIGALARG